jgi:hypothetical protein
MMRRLLTGLGLSVLLSYPMLFYAHKYMVPWIGGGTDFRSYHTMVLDPLNFGAVRAPFAMRQLTALVAHGILKIGLIFPNNVAFDHFTSFEGKIYDPDVFFALILANVIGVMLAGAFVYATVARDLPHWSEASTVTGLSIPGLLAVCLMLLSGPLLFHVFAPLTEGWSWFLMAAGFYFYREHGRLAYAALLVLPAAVFQRELLPLVFVGLAGTELLSRRSELDTRRRQFLLTIFAGSLLALLAYYLLRAYILPVAHTDLGQISPALWPQKLATRITDPAIITKFVRVLVKMNLVILWGCAVILALRQGLHGWDRHILYAMAMISVLFTLIALAVGADAATDRYLAILTPLFTVSIIELLHRPRPGSRTTMC